jgi:hypothetical protein
MTKLKVMGFVDTDISKSIDFILANNVSFPALKTWRYGGTWMKRK